MWAQLWNNSGTNPDPNTLASVGLGLQLALGNVLQARLDWGIPLISVDSSERTLQEQGLLFSIIVNPF
jgi:hemolysin activation/secretion protein